MIFDINTTRDISELAGAHALLVFMPNITTNHAITNTKTIDSITEVLVTDIA